MTVTDYKAIKTVVKHRIHYQLGEAAAATAAASAPAATAAASAPVPAAVAVAATAVPAAGGTSGLCFARFLKLIPIKTMSLEPDFVAAATQSGYTLCVMVKIAKYCKLLI